jgi:hypothetical protein
MDRADASTACARESSGRLHCHASAVASWMCRHRRRRSGPAAGSGESVLHRLDHDRCLEDDPDRSSGRTHTSRCSGGSCLADAQAPGLQLVQAPGVLTSHCPGDGEDGGRSRPRRCASDAGAGGTSHPRAVVAADRVSAAGGAAHCVELSERLDRLSVTAPASGRGSGG